MWFLIFTVIVFIMFLSDKVNGTKIKTFVREHFTDFTDFAQVDKTGTDILGRGKYVLGEYDLPWDQLYGKSNKLRPIIYSTSADYSADLHPKFGQ
jgi:hypothetical protein